MKNFGTLKLDDAETGFRVYVFIHNGMLMVDFGTDGLFCDGYVTVHFDGPYCGSMEDMRAYIRRSVKAYLLEKNIVSCDGMFYEYAETKYTITNMRNATGMTQKEFAEYLQIPLRTIENWEMGVNEPSVYKIDGIRLKLQSYKKPE